jgi:hypothetical protein
MLQIRNSGQSYESTFLVSIVWPVQLFIPFVPAIVVSKIWNVPGHSQGNMISSPSPLSANFLYSCTSRFEQMNTATEKHMFTLLYHNLSCFAFSRNTF